MRNKIVTCSLTAFLLVFSGGCGYMREEIAADYIAAASTTSNTIWTEIPINEGSHKIAFTYAEFDANELVANADYVFRGTVVDRKEYEVQWVDENGQSWGPFPSSVIEIQISKEYFGESPVDGNTIKVYYPMFFVLYGKNPLTLYQ